MTELELRELALVMKDSPQYPESSVGATLPVAQLEGPGSHPESLLRHVLGLPVISTAWI